MKRNAQISVASLQLWKGQVCCCYGHVPSRRHCYKGTETNQVLGADCIVHTVALTTFFVIIISYLRRMLSMLNKLPHLVGNLIFLRQCFRQSCLNQFSLHPLVALFKVFVFFFVFVKTDQKHTLQSAATIHQNAIVPHQRYQHLQPAAEGSRQNWTFPQLFRSENISSFHFSPPFDLEMIC